MEVNSVLVFEMKEAFHPHINSKSDKPSEHANDHRDQPPLGVHVSEILLSLGHKELKLYPLGFRVNILLLQHAVNVVII
jgi:hypothetical protein